MSESALRSGEVADAAVVNVQTWCYYERRVLLHGQDPQPRGAGPPRRQPADCPPALSTGRYQCGPIR
jgi:hypothetical protein